MRIRLLTGVCLVVGVACGGNGPCDASGRCDGSLIVKSERAGNRLEYSTWAGMIVTQYGRLHNGRHPQDPRFVACRVEGGGIPGARASPALTDLQRYYGTGGTFGRDVSSEPGDFRPGPSLPGPPPLHFLCHPLRPLFFFTNPCPSFPR